jgi:DNA transformation protein and related proteins
VTRLRDLRNLGPASERMLAAAGITTLEQLDRLGAAEAYRRTVEAGAHPSLNLLWAMEGALLDLDWRQVPREGMRQLLAEVEKS